MTDETLRTLLQGSRRDPLRELEENEDDWIFRTFSISKRRAAWNNGFGHELWPESNFYKRWFNFPDLGMMGWAILFHVADPFGDPVRAKLGTNSEQFPGWVPPERVADADRWIAFLNGEVRKRIAEATAKRESDRSE